MMKLYCMKSKKGKKSSFCDAQYWIVNKGGYFSTRFIHARFEENKRSNIDIVKRNI